MMVTQERLKQLLIYDQETGVFVWRVKRPLVSIGSRAGRLDSGGACQISIDGKRYLAHRLAWLYVHGYFPELIDHKNRNPSDNSLSNLRIATRSQNRANSKIDSKNHSGYKGVCWHKEMKKFTAQVNINGVRTKLGYWDNPADAHAAYMDKARELYGEFACQG